jgi:ankyrin repeat protein
VEGTEPHKDGVTALMLAAQGGHAALAQLLVERGADVNKAVSPKPVY